MKNGQTPQFLRPLAVTPLADGVNWRLDEPLTFIDAQGGRHVIPKGFETDFASIPDLARIAVWFLIVTIPAGWWLLGSGHWKWFAASAIGSAFALWVAAIARRLDCDATDAPATVHDYQYRVVRNNRAYSDGLLWQGMVATEVTPWKRLIIWGNVRLFGFAAWNGDGKMKAASKFQGTL